MSSYLWSEINIWRVHCLVHCQHSVNINFFIIQLQNCWNCSSQQIEALYKLGNGKSGTDMHFSGFGSGSLEAVYTSKWKCLREWVWATHTLSALSVVKSSNSGCGGMGELSRLQQYPQPEQCAIAEGSGGGKMGMGVKPKRSEQTARSIEDIEKPLLG